MGPRQVGKSTICLSLKDSYTPFYYYNWDDEEDREKILKGGQFLAQEIGIPREGPIPLVVFDEIHKYRRWKLFLKGLHDRYRDHLHIIVTGSARLNDYRRGGDSLMGRYFSYRVHPFSVAEVVDPTHVPNSPISAPRPINEQLFSNLWTFGGFPDPFIKGDQRFYNRWRTLKNQQLFKEDLRDLSQVQALDQIEMLGQMVTHQVGQLTTFDSLSKKIRVADTTVRNWMKILASLYYTFEVRPWSTNVPRGLRKEPKYYLWDWSLCADEGAKGENFVASHLLKAVNFWTDHGFGEFSLYFVRDKSKREVDFLVTKDGQPWFLVEVKKSNNKGLSPSLEYFHQLLGTKHAFQVVIDEPFVNQDCFQFNEPVIVSARTLLSQLI